MALSGADTGVGTSLVRNIGCEKKQPRKQQDFEGVSRIPKAYCLHIPILQEQCWDQALWDTVRKVWKTHPFLTSWVISNSNPLTLPRSSLPMLLTLTLHCWARTTYTPVNSSVIKKIFPKSITMHNYLSTGSICLSHGRKTTQSLTEPLPDWVSHRPVSPFSKVWEKASWDSCRNGLKDL